MLRWHTLGDERMALYSPIGLKPVDRVTGGAPIGWLHVYLEVDDGTGGWRRRDVEAVMSPGSVISYPGLGRRAAPGGAMRRHRVRVETQFYVPLYRATQDAIEFDVFPYDDVDPPQNLAAIRAHQPSELVLAPSPQYAFSSHVPVLRGLVRDAAGAAVPDVLVADGTREQAVTDARGAFALPLRWARSNPAPVIKATDQRGGRAGSVTIQFPQDLRTSQTIIVA